MCNVNLVIIINDEDVINVSGRKYTERDKAILIAMTEWRNGIDKIKKECDFPEEIIDIVNSIKIYEV